MKDKYNIKFYKGISKITNFYIDKHFKPIVKGIENINNEGLLLIGNHLSAYDILLIAYALKDYTPRFMAKKEFFDSSFKWFFEKAGAFPIDRDKVDMEAIKTAVKLLKEKNIVVIFPEGTRNRTDEIMLPFKRGISSLALLGNVNIVPFAITGEYRRKSSPMIEFGESINLKEIDVSRKHMDDYLEDKIKKLILNNSR